MSDKVTIRSIRVLPESVANKIAAGEVVERPASVVKELVENALDAGATRIAVRVVAAGRRRIDVIDNGHGMSEHDALLSIERHATSKIRNADDLDNIGTLGFRGEAVASIAAVSRFELVTRRAKDDEATRVRVDGGLLRDVSKVAAPVGTRVTVNRLYFNTPVRAKFLKGVTTELSQCIDVVQRHALCHSGVGFQCFHNDKPVLDVPENAGLRERVALIWGLSLLENMVEVNARQAGLAITGLVGTPALSRAQRSHQFFALNGRPVVNRSLQHGLEEAYRSLLTIGRHPMGVLSVNMHGRFVDVNIHPTKREIRFRDERAARAAVRDVVRAALDDIRVGRAAAPVEPASEDTTPQAQGTEPRAAVVPPPAPAAPPPDPAVLPSAERQTEFVNPPRPSRPNEVQPDPVYEPLGTLASAPMQVFDTYLIVPDGDRLLIIDQHALHERLTFDCLRADLADANYASQQLAVPLLIDVPPSHARLVDNNLALFASLGIDIESFGGNTYQVTSVCHMYAESRVADAVFRVLDALAQGDLFDPEAVRSDLLRLALTACRGSVKAGDPLTPEERQGLIQGFRDLRPPYTCPHGRPIVTELTQRQMEISFRRRT